MQCLKALFTEDVDFSCAFFKYSNELKKSEIFVLQQLF